MNKKSLLLFTLLLAPQFAFAADDLCKAIVEQLKDGKNIPQIVEKVGSDDSINTSAASNILDLVTASYNGYGEYQSQSGATEKCTEELSAQLRGKLLNTVRQRNGNTKSNDPGVSAVAGGAVGGGVAAGVDLDLSRGSSEIRLGARRLAEETTTRSPASLENCEFLRETESCEFSPTEFRSMMAQFSAALTISTALLPSDLSHCQCITSKAQKAYPNTVEQIRLVAERKQNLKKLVKDNFNKRFINRYGAHLEDVRYFAQNARSAFSATPERVISEVRSVQCSNSEEFKDALKSQCQLPDAELNEKMDSIFSVLGEKAEGFSYLNTLNREVMINSSVPGQKMSRSDFDAVRSGMVTNDKNVRFADSFVAQILKDKDAVASIMNDKSKSPYNALIGFIAKEIGTNKRRFLNKYINNDIIGDAKFRELQTEFNDIPKALDTLTGVLDFAIETHPGLDNLLKKKDLFQQAANKIKNRDGSAIALLENSTDLMLPRFKKECDELKADLAQYLCTKEDDLVKNVGKNELRKLVKESGDTSSLLLDDLAICKNGSMRIHNGPFTQLAFDETDRKSDILERLTNKDYKTHKNLFTRIVKGNKEASSETKQYIAQAAQQGYSSAGIIEDSFSSQFDIKSSEKVSFVNPKNSGAGSAQPISQTADAVATKDDSRQQPTTQFGAETPAMLNPGYATNFAAPVKEAEVATAKPATQASSDLRNELREFLGQKEGKESVDKMMKDASDSQVAELARLREEALKSREQLLALQSEGEKAKLKQIQDQLSSLEEQREKAVAQNVSPEESESEERSSGRGSRDIASVASEAGGATSGFAGRTGGSSSGASSSSSGSGDSSSTSGAKAVRADLLNGSGEVASSSDPVVFSSAQARSGSLEIKSSELSKEVLTFLESEPDVQTLINMRRSGMLYKYKVVENGKEVDKEIMIDYKNLNDDVKKLIDQKIADSGRAGTEAQRLSAEIKNLRRTYSYNSLKIILGEQLKR